ncbi:acyl carrier protein [Streptomyces sp. NPDC021020]|uniref:acyl carrier protein n=1 Tax=Streptomyces sp. NPDC021020 TaxID=3365109 RepID=UPI0037A2FFC5
MSAPQGAVAATADIRTTIAEVMRAVLERDVDPAVDVFDQGATSLAFIRITAQLSDRFGIRLDVGELEEASIDAMAELVARQLESREPAEAGNGR